MPRSFWKFITSLKFIKFFFQTCSEWWWIIYIIKVAFRPQRLWRPRGGLNDISHRNKNVFPVAKVYDRHHDETEDISCFRWKEANISCKKVRPSICQETESRKLAILTKSEEAIRLYCLKTENTFVDLHNTCRRNRSWRKRWKCKWW